MAYIGKSPITGKFQKLDDISSGFNDSATTFAVQSGGSDVIIESAQQLLVSIDGVLQEPTTAYTTSSSGITFTEAPNTNATFFAILLGETGVVNVVTPNDLSVTAGKLATDAVETAKIKDLNVTAGKLATDAVETAKIKDLNVTTDKIAALNVTTAKIADTNITAGKLATDAVETLKIKDLNVTTAKIAALNVTTAKIAALNVTNEKIAADAVSSAKIAPLVNLQEDTSLVAAAFDATTNIDLLTNSVYFNPNAADTNFKVNFRADASTSLNSIMAIGNTMSAAVMVTNTGTPYYINAHEVDGSSVTPKYQGGTAYSAGNANSIDIYTFSIIKTADATFTLIAAQTKHA